MTEKFSSIIIGAGMGGMCAAARLTAAGQRVLVVEKSPYLGGRCSHRTRNECQVTTGAIMIPIAESSAIRQAFDLLDVPMDTVELTGRMRYRLPHGDYDQQESGGGLRGIIGFALEGDEKRTERLFQDFIAAIKDIPGDSYTFRDWLEQHTDNDNVINLFQGFCAALMGTNLHEIPAGEFFRFLAYSSRGSRFGMAVNGNGALMDALAEAIEKRGSRVLRRTAPEGGTNMKAAMDIVMTMSPPPDNIILLVDGLPTMDGPTSNRRTVSGQERTRLFTNALRELPSNIPVNIFLYPLEGDFEAPFLYWLLAYRSGGSFISVSKDWP